ncbi:APC family permease [Nocardioides sp.]|uniref:APC family permease n=1 Tax=Nocardioides sp. TaxID=35761 RepID=UPI003515B2CB
MAHTLDQAGSGQLRKNSLGARDIVFFVMAAAAPLTVMVAVAPIALLIGGVGAAAGYLAAGLVCIVFSYGYTRMAKHVHNNGAFYSYVRHGLGKPAGVAAALVALLSYTGLILSTFGVFGGATADTMSTMFGIDAPWWVWGLIGAAIVAVLGYQSIDLGAKVLAVLLVAEVAVLAVLCAAVLFQGGADGLSLEPFAPSNVFNGNMGAVLAVAFAAFCGFEATAIYRSEARDPDRTVPRATYVAVTFMALFYGFVLWVIVMAFGVVDTVPTVAANPVAPFFTAMDTYVGGFATDVMRLLLITSGLAALLAFHNAINRYGYALGREVVLPRVLAKVHDRHGSPYAASMIQTVICVVAVIGFGIGGAQPLTQLAAWTAGIGVIGIVSLLSLTSLAAAVFFLRPGRDRNPVTAAVSLVAMVLLIGCLALVLLHLDIATLTTNKVVNTTIVALPVLTFVAGLVYAAILRSARPELYAALGTTDADEPVREEKTFTEPSAPATPFAGPAAV